MPELPEVETTRSGIAPYVEGKRVTHVVVRESRLRRPIAPQLATELGGAVVESVTRRGKYLLLRTHSGTLIVHLGMSGSLRIVDVGEVAEKHDHVDIVFAEGKALRMRDPRRFGLMVWTREDSCDHALLNSLGPEPLDPAFDGDCLYAQARGRRVAVKSFIMDSRVVVGVGNIYANEALFGAGLRPSTPAGRVSRMRYQRLAEEIKAVLTAAIRQGGTTLRDFVGGEGKPGYFSLQLQVYGREGEPCPRCGRAVKVSRLGQRSTYYCTSCQR